MVVTASLVLAGLVDSMEFKTGYHHLARCVAGTPAGFDAMVFDCANQQG